MKKKIVIITLIVCLAAGMSSLFYAYASNKAVQLEQAQAKQIEAIETQTEAKLERVLAQRDMETILRNNGLYEDEVRKNMTKYLETIALYQIPQEHIDLFLDRAEQGKNLAKLLDIYRFLFFSSRDYSLIDAIYEKGANSNFCKPYWLEDAFQTATEYRSGLLQDGEISSYREQGVSLSDMLLANNLSFKGVKTIQQILNQRAAGDSWFAIISSIYPEAKLESGKFGEEEGSVIFEHIKLSRLNQESPNQGYDKNETENGKISQFAQNKLSAKSAAAVKLASDREVFFSLGSEMMAYAKQKLPSLNEEEIRLYIEEKGYLIREIEKGLQIAAREDIPLEQAIKSGKSEGNEISEMEEEE